MYVYYKKFVAYFAYFQNVVEYSGCICEVVTSLKYTAQ